MGGKRPFAGTPRSLAGVGVKCSSYSKTRAAGVPAAISVAAKVRQLFLTDPGDGLQRGPSPTAPRHRPARSLLLEPSRYNSWARCPRTQPYQVVVCYSHSSDGGTAAGCVATVAGTAPFSCCAPLGAGCVTAVTTLTSPCCAPLGLCRCRPPVARVSHPAFARTHDRTVVCRPRPMGDVTPT